MENKLEENILNLMQHLVDKLDELSKKVTHSKHTQGFDELSLQIKVLIKIFTVVYKEVIKGKENFFLQGEILNQKVDETYKLLTEIKQNRIPINNNETNEYYIFGKDSLVSLKTIFIGLGLTVFIYTGIKFLPPLFFENRKLQKGKEMYQQFYNYLYLSEFKEKGESENSIQDLLLKIKKRDADFVEEYYRLKTTYEKSIKKQRLEKELKELQ